MCTHVKLRLCTACLNSLTGFALNLVCMQNCDCAVTAIPKCTQVVDVMHGVIKI